MAARRQAPARAMKARCARETRHSRRDAAPPAGSGRRGRRSTTPRATRAATAARSSGPAGTHARGSAFRRDRSLPGSKRDSRRSISANTDRTSSPPSASRTTRATVPIVGKLSSSTRALVPRPSAVRRVVARRRRGRGSHLGAVRLLQVRDLPRAGLCRHRRRRGAFCADRRRRTNSPTPPAAAAATTVQRARAVTMRHGRRPGLARAGGKLRMALGRWHGYRPCPRPRHYDPVERPGRSEMTTQVATGSVKDSAAGTQKWVYDFAEGSREMRDLLGGKGAGVAEMTRILGPDMVPAGFTITTEACVAYMRGGAWPEGLRGAGERGAVGAREASREAPGRRGRSAARLGALGRARVDAGDDGHGAQPGPER